MSKNEWSRVRNKLKKIKIKKRRRTKKEKITPKNKYRN